MSFFPQDYVSARARFEEQCQKNKKSLFRPNVVISKIPPKWTKTFKQVTGIFKKDGNKKLPYLTSGVHGSESYAGSAISGLTFGIIQVTYSQKE